jgi:hypothetical protein
VGVQTETSSANPKKKERTAEFPPTSPLFRLKEDELCFGELYNLGESLWAPRCEIGKHLTVDEYLFFVQGIDQAGIRGAVQPGCGVDARNPELAKRSFLVMSITICVLASFIKMVLRNRKDFTSRTPVAFRASEDTLAAAVGGNFILRTWHVALSSLC